MKNMLKLKHLIILGFFTSLFLSMTYIVCAEIIHPYDDHSGSDRMPLYTTPWHTPQLEVHTTEKPNSNDSSSEYEPVSNRDKINQPDTDLDLSQLLVALLRGFDANNPQHREFYNHWQQMINTKGKENTLAYLNLMIEIKNKLEKQGGSINPLDKKEFNFLENVAQFVESQIKQGKNKDQIIFSIVQEASKLRKEGWGWDRLTINTEGRVRIISAIGPIPSLENRVKGRFSEAKSLKYLADSLVTYFGAFSNIPSGYLEKYFTAEQILQIKDMVQKKNDQLLANCHNNAKPIFDSATSRALTPEQFALFLDALEQTKGWQDYLARQPIDAKAKAVLNDLFNFGIALIPYIGNIPDIMSGDEEKAFIGILGLALDISFPGSGVAVRTGTKEVLEAGGKNVARRLIRGEARSMVISELPVSAGSRGLYEGLKQVVPIQLAPTIAIKAEDFLKNFNSHFLNDAYLLLKKHRSSITPQTVRDGASNLMRGYGDRYGLRINFVTESDIRKLLRLGTNEEMGAGYFYKTVDSNGATVNQILIRSDLSSADQLEVLSHEYIHFRIENGLLADKWHFAGAGDINSGSHEIIAYQWNLLVRGRFDFFGKRWAKDSIEYFIYRSR